MTSIAQRGQKRGFVWWLRNVVLWPLAFLGILGGGPIAMAQLTSEVIHWKGPIRYVVHFWGEHVSEPAHKTLSFLLAWVHVSPPQWLTDYLTLGFLLGFAVRRIRNLVEPLKELPELVHEKPSFLQEARSLSLAAAGFAYIVLVWPIAMVSMWGIVWLQTKAHRFKHLPELNRRIVKFGSFVSLLATAPFVLFVCLCLVNFLLA